MSFYCRKFDKNINCFYEQAAKSPKSPRKFDFNSPKFDYSIEDDDDNQKQKQINRSWSKGSNGPGSGGTSGNNSGYYEQRSPKYYDKSPKSPRKFEYDAISPKYEKGTSNLIYETVSEWVVFVNDVFVFVKVSKNRKT